MKSRQHKQRHIEAWKASGMSQAAILSRAGIECQDIW